MLPLVVDLDGTLIRSDLLVESGLMFARQHPLRSLAPLVWLASGKAHLKGQLAKYTELEIAGLPYDSRVLDLIEEERAKGRQIILATASHRIFADQVAQHVKLFDRVLATEGDTNLSARKKRDRLVQEFGDKGFDYVGNSADDLPVWASARRAYVVNPERGVEERARALGNVERVIPSETNVLRGWVKAMRFHQWMKNLLVFVPLLASHRLGHVDLLFNGLLAFLFFGLCASSVYLLNDMLDLPDDRQHATKRKRPFASGVLSLQSGLLAFPALLVAAFAGSLWLLPPMFVVALAGYYGMTLAYSLVLKRRMVVDVITLAMLYTVRIVAGTFAFAVSATFWMLAFSMFIFLSLALVKRYAELHEGRSRGKTQAARGRGYYADDLPMLASLGGAAGYMSVMVLALYIQDQNTMALYRHPEVIWLACPLMLFWISRTWLMTHRGEMHEDPVVFAIKDKISLATGALFGAIFWIAT